MVPLHSRFASAFRPIFGLSGNSPDEVSNGIRGTRTSKLDYGVGKFGIIQKDRLEIHSDPGEQGFILLNEDIDAVLDGDKRDIRRLDARDLAHVRPVISIGEGVEYCYFTVLLSGSFAFGVTIAPFVLTYVTNFFSLHTQPGLSRNIRMPQMKS